MRLFVIVLCLLFRCFASGGADGQEGAAVASGVAGQGDLLPDYPVVFTCPDAHSPCRLSLVNDAQLIGRILRLTPAAEGRKGAAWFPRRQPVCNGFETVFEFRLTGQDPYPRYRGADGFAFVIQNDGPAAIGNQGGASAFAGGDGFSLPRMQGISRSIAVFFDTYMNSDVGDPSGNYIAICGASGTRPDIPWPPRRLAHTPRLRMHLKDGQVHRVRILYKPPVVSVFLDHAAVPVLSTAVDLSRVVGPDSAAYVGFTAATGSGYQNHDILNWSFACGSRAHVASNLSVVDSEISFMKAACLPTGNLCTPDRVIIEERGSGRYHIVLPANLEWGARISTPQSAVVRIENASGIVCWDPDRRDALGCNGPTGGGVVHARKSNSARGLLAPAAPAGALIWTTRQGWTYFSINDHIGDAFLNNQGYFEFDVRLTERSR